MWKKDNSVQRGQGLLVILVVLVPLLAQLHETFLLRNYVWKCFFPTHNVTLAAQAVVAALLGWAGWRVLGATQRMAWLFSCILSFLVVLQGQRMENFYSGVAPDWAGPEAVAVTFQCLLIPLLVAWQRPSALNSIVRVGLGLVAFFGGALCLGQYVLAQFGFSVPSRILIDSYGIYSDASRVSGFTTSPNVMGAVLVICWPAFLGQARRGRPLARIGQAAAICVAILGIVVTFSRAAYLAVLVQACLLAWLARSANDPATRRRFAHELAIVLGTLLLAALIMHPVARRFAYLTQPSDLSVQRRIDIYQAALTMTAERPLCGWGTGMFSILFNGFDRVPGVAYTYADAHSAILLWLFEYGLLGCLLSLLAVTGWHVRRLFSRLPVWVLLTFLGAVPVLISDNVYLRTCAVGIPLLMAAAVAAGIARVVDRRTERLRWATAAFACAGLCWVVAALVPPKEPIDRLTARLERCVRRISGDVRVAVCDLSTGAHWGVADDKPAGSVLAGAAVVAKSALKAPDEPTELTNWKIAPAAPAPINVSVPAADVVALMLDRLNPAAIGALRQSLPEERLQAACVEFFGHAAPCRGEWNGPCASSASLDVHGGDQRNWSAQVSLTTSASMEQLIHAYWRLLDRKTTGSAVVRTALKELPDRDGFARHLLTEQTMYGLSFYTGAEREEVLVVANGWDVWGIAGHYDYSTDLVPWADSVVNRMFGELGWRLACYMESFSGLPAPDGSRTKQPWFLRVGVQRWPMGRPAAH
jgi:hypothetical protein